MLIEKRLHPKILVDWPAAIKTLKGAIGVGNVDIILVYVTNG